MNEEIKRRDEIETVKESRIVQNENRDPVSLTISGHFLMNAILDMKKGDRLIITGESERRPRVVFVKT